LSSFNDLIKALKALKQNRLSVSDIQRIAQDIQRIAQELASADLNAFLDNISHSLAPSEIIAGSATFGLLRNVAVILIDPNNPDKNPDLASKIYPKLIGAENTFLKEIKKAQAEYREKLEKALSTADLSLGADWHDLGVARQLLNKFSEAREAYQAAFYEDKKRQGESIARRMMAWCSLARLTAIDAAVLNQNKFSLSAFVTAWISIEMTLGRLWLTELSNQGCNAILQECLKEWDVFNVIESLGKLNKLSADEVKTLNQFRKIRNKAVHFEQSPDYPIADKCWRFALSFADKTI